MKQTKVLRDLLRKDGVVLAASAYDALTAKIIEASGIDVVATSGYAISAGLIGKPDVGLLTMSENLMVVRNIVGVVNVPVISDIDTGYGNAINVMRTIQEFEKAGVAGILLEDQLAPKKCGCQTGLEVISKEEMIGKIKAAVDARKDPDFVIIVRTDAKGNEAIERGQAYAEAGADLVKAANKCFNSIEGFRAFAKAAKKPIYVTVVGWIEAQLSFEELKDAGAKVISFPLLGLLSATKAVMEAMSSLKRNKWTHEFREHMVSMEEFNKFIGMPDAVSLEEKYLPPV